MLNTNKTYWERDKNCLKPNIAFLLLELEKVNHPSESNNPIITSRVWGTSFTAGGLLIEFK